MSRLGALILGSLLICALLLVTSQHRARKLVTDLERAQSVSRQYEVEWNQLVLDQTQHAKHSLVDAVARRELKMQPVTPERTIYLKPASRGAN